MDLRRDRPDGAALATGQAGGGRGPVGRLLFESHPLPLLWLEDGRIVAANAAAVALLGAEAASLAGTPLVDHAPPFQPDGSSTAETFAERVRQAHAGWPQAVAWRFLRRDGATIESELLLAADGTFREGGLLAMIHATRDDGSRDAALVAQLAGGIAHDLNNHLAAVLGQLDLASQAGVDEASWPARLQRARRSLQSAEALTRRLMALGRPATPAIHALDVAAVLGEVAEAARRLPSGPVDVLVSAPPGLPPVEGVRSQIERVILDLATRGAGGHARRTVSFAARAVEHDVPFVAAHPGARAGRYVRIEIRDGGPGLSPETCRNFFDVRWTDRAPGPDASAPMAFSLACAVVKHHRGYIEVASTPEGNVFRLDLPVLTVPSSGTRASDAKAADLAREAKTILVVEDEPAIRDLSVQVLRDRGYDVLAASSAEQACELVASHGERLDLLVTDLSLPGMGGTDLAVEMRRHYPALRVVFTSGHDAGTLPGGLESEAQRLLHKPYRLRQLCERVAEVLG